MISKYVLKNKPDKPSDVNIGYELIFEDSEFGNFLKNLQSHQPPPVGHVFKLNGDFDEKEKGNKRFKPFLDSLKGVEKDLNTDKMEVLKYFLKNFDFCFLGYNCSDDYSIYTVLKDTIRECFGSIMQKKPLKSYLQRNS
jgi:hypothetical protein